MSEGAAEQEDRPVVELRFTEEEDLYGTYSYYPRVLVNGEPVSGQGTYGGEPEDNSRRRDYKWVEETLQKLAEKLGAVVTVVGAPPEEGAP